jgi:hypothetical protein
LHFPSPPPRQYQFDADHQFDADCPIFAVALPTQSSKSPCCDLVPEKGRLKYPSAVGQTGGEDREQYVIIVAG